MLIQGIGRQHSLAADFVIELQNRIGIGEILVSSGGVFEAVQGQKVRSTYLLHEAGLIDLAVIDTQEYRQAADDIRAQAPDLAVPQPHEHGQRFRIHFRTF